MLNCFLLNIAINNKGANLALCLIAVPTFETPKEKTNDNVKITVKINLYSSIFFNVFLFL